MKKIYILTAVLAGMLVLAQEAGKAGELLKNEANARDMQIRTEGRVSAEVNRGQEIPNYGNSQRNTTGNRRGTPRYQWNQNFGYSEVFLRIPEYGHFTVEVGDQVLSASTGKFRFFDLSSGRIPVSIYQNGYLMYRTQLNLQNNTRVVLDFFSQYGLYLLDSYPVQSYGFNQWDDVWNTPYGGGSLNPRSGGMDHRTFDGFMQSLKRNAPFDKDKLAFIDQQVGSSWFQAQQIRMILKSFSFDENRVQAGRMLYSRCSDLQNFFVVYEAFSFDRGRRELMDFVAAQR